MSLTRRDKKLLTDIEFNLMVSNEASIPLSKLQALKEQLVPTIIAMTIWMEISENIPK